MNSYNKLLGKALDHLQALKFDRKHAWHVVLVALYCSIVEYSDTLLRLTKEGKSIGLPLIARGMLEAFVDLKNLSENKTYGNDLEMSYLSEWLRVAKESDSSENPFLRDVRESENLSRQIEEWESQVIELKIKGANKLSQYQKFELAGMSHEYRSIYNFLCAHSHNNKRALIERFVVINDDNSDFNLEIFREIDEDENQEYLIIGQEYLLQGSKIIHRVLGTGLENEFKDIEEPQFSSKNECSK